MQRLLRESRAAASVSHSAVARTKWVDVSEQGVIYLVQELVDGEPLGRVLRLQRTFSGGEVARLGATLAAALAEAHAAGVVHRDLKPSNVMMTAVEPGLKLLDFGIARLAEDPTAPEVTRSGHLVGTPDYMAPEQFLTPDCVDPSIDVYAFGRVLFRALAGRLPDQGSPFAARLVLDPVPVNAFAPSVPPQLAELALACLARHPEDRPKAATLVKALAAIADRGGTPSLPALAARWVSAVREGGAEESRAVTRQGTAEQLTWTVGRSREGRAG